MKHLGRHLEELALFALPRHEPDPEASHFSSTEPREEHYRESLSDASMQSSQDLKLKDALPSDQIIDPSGGAPRGIDGGSTEGNLEMSHEPVEVIHLDLGVSQDLTGLITDHELCSLPHWDLNPGSMGPRWFKKTVTGVCIK